jgi:hypothetical protein
MPMTRVEGSTAKLEGKSRCPWQSHATLKTTRFLLFVPNAEFPSMSAMSSRPYVKISPCCIHEVTNKISSSRARKRPRRQGSLPSSSTALTPPPSPTRPESSTVIGSRSGSSLTTEKHARRRTGKKSTNRRQRTSFAQYPTMSAD